MNVFTYEQNNGSHGLLLASTTRGIRLQQGGAVRLDAPTAAAMVRGG